MNEFVKRIITIVGAVAGLVAVLIAVGIVFLITVVDPNDYKAQVEDAAKQGQIELKIQGDLAWQFFEQAIPNSYDLLSDGIAPLPMYATKSIIRETMKNWIEEYFPLGAQKV